VEVDDLRARVSGDLSRLCNEEGVPGASVVVIRGAHVIETTAGVVNARTRVPVTPDTLFQIQSITKIFTATLVMQLVDEGLVDLDRPVNIYLPGFHTADPRASEHITVRHLLTHTGGFEGDLWQPTTSGADALDRFVRDLVTRARQHSPPGRRFSYCNAGFGVLGRLVETLRGSTYEQAFRRHLADPLGIDELAFSAGQALAFRTAIGHVRPVPTAPLRPIRVWAVLPPSNPAAGNQLAMSARALSTLGQLFVFGGQGRDGAQILAPQTAALMLERHLRHRGTVPAPTYQGLGWRLPKDGVAEHGGGAPGVATMLTIAPRHGVVAVVLTNADAGARLTRRLLDPILAEIADVPPTPALPTSDAGARVADTQPFVGLYATRQSRLEVADDGDRRLWLTQQPQNDEVTMAGAAGIKTVNDRREIRPVDDETFALIGDDGRATDLLTFLEPGPDGRFQLLANDRVAPRV
jgi:CubicO group peptidase (beta-lactamase class C family)